jgi:hypothetical protein
MKEGTMYWNKHTKLITHPSKCDKSQLKQRMPIPGSQNPKSKSSPQRRMMIIGLFEESLTQAFWPFFNVYDY